MNTQTEFLTLDDAATMRKVSVDGLLSQAVEGLVQLYWLLNRTLYSDNMELQPVGVYPSYHGQDKEEWESNLTAVPIQKHFAYIPLNRENAGELLTDSITRCWVAEINTPEETFSLAEPEVFTVTRQHVALLRDDVADWDKSFEQFARPTGDALKVGAGESAIEDAEPDQMPDESASGEYADAQIALLFDPVTVAALENMFPADNKWAKWAERAARNGLATARYGRAKFNPYLAGIWFAGQGIKGWDLAHCRRRLGNNLPARSLDSKHLLTGELE